jgi:L-lactate dehydrogenase complex protein LldE
MRVGLFSTCLVDLMRPEIGMSVLKLLEDRGYEVIVPMEQTCCGQPPFNSGNRSSASALAKKLITEFESLDYVVIPSGSCAGMIKTHYSYLLQNEPDWHSKAKNLADKCYELTQFLSLFSEPKRIKLEPVAKDKSLKVTYHDSCSGLRELGIKQQPRDLMAHSASVELIEMKDSTTCCGFGGMFSEKYGEISCAIAHDKCEQILETGAQAVVLGDLGCMMNIEGRLSRLGRTDVRVLHIAQLLTGEA